MAQSPYLRRARKRTTIARARKLAPVIPTGPEAQLRALVVSVLGQYQARLKRKALSRVKKLGFADDLLAYGRALIRKVSGAVGVLAAALARSALAQVKKSVGKEPDTTLEEQTAAMKAEVEKMLLDRMERSNERASKIMDEVDPEDDPDALDKKFDDGLDGVLGGGLASAALIYGAAWATMNQDAQESAGVERYVWVAQRDQFTRPAHAELDDTIARWDTPPLTADKSSNGEPCHAGEDFNCRCLAAPLPPPGSAPN
jgi:SPP1 gp7 family putative phage head morphogenesis protein